MTTSTSAARWVARAVASALWIVGSAYLIKGELANPSPDYVLIASIPVIWLVVCALPILVSEAVRDRQWIAAAVMMIGAVVGSAYTLTGTLGRQSDVRDRHAVEAAEVAKQRTEIERELKQAKGMLAEAIAKCGAGRTCLASTQATISVYTGAVAGHQSRIDKLKPMPPSGIEVRVAASLAVIFGGTAADYMVGVGLFLPCLLGMTCEIGMLGAAMYGWHRLPTVSRRPALASDLTGTDAYTDVELEHLRKLLQTVGRPVSNNELAGLMNCCKAEASKRVSDAVRAGLVSRRRVGREVAITLH